MTAQTEHSKRRRRRGRRRLDLSRSGHSSSRGGRAAVVAVAAAKSLGGTTPMCTPRETENSPWLVDPRSLLAVTGIFTIDSHAEYRRNIRHTWAVPGEVSDGILTRFVMRGQDAAGSTLRESLAHSDIELLPAPANLSRTVGPLVTLFLWFECALSKWPAAELIGKADDDVWVHLGGVAAFLRGTSMALQRPPHATPGAPRPLLYWGNMHNFHWDDHRGAPVGWASGWGSKRDCNTTSRGGVRGSGVRWTERDAFGTPDALTTGPFPFAMGPLNYLSAQLCKQLLASVELSQHVAGTMNRTTYLPKHATPWEDVYTGFALAQVAHALAPPGKPPPLLAFVNMGWCAQLAHQARGRPPEAAMAAVADRARHHLSEGWDLSMANSSLVWHMKTKAPGRIGLVHDWAQDHHCHPSADELIIRCMRHWASCNGADWLRCAESPESIARCSKQKISLKDRMRKGLWAPQSREHQ